MTTHVVGASRAPVSLAILVLAACGGGGGGGGPPPIYAVSGTVSGLSGSGLVLRDNGGDDLTISSNGSFTFATRVTSGAAYAVSVQTQPTGPSQTCTVGNATGQVRNANVTGVTITCTTNTYSVGGNVTGLAGSGLVLVDNGGDALTVSVDGTFTFATPVASGSTYGVSVQTQPTGPSQTCVVSHGAGTVGGGPVADVTLACTTNLYAVGGTVSGLVGSGLVLLDNGGDALTVSANGTLTFATPVASGATYSVRVQTQPTGPSQTCVVSHGDGTVGGGPVTDVALACTTNLYSVGGTVSGVAGSGLVLLDNGGDALTVSANGTFAFATPVASGAAYRVTVQSQPANPTQICSVGGSSGVLSAANVSSIAVTCTSRIISLFAGSLGGAGTADGVVSLARFSRPYGVTTDTMGNLYVADSQNNTIRKITPGGVVTTLAGQAGVVGGADGIGAAAQFNYPEGIATDAAGNVYVADTGNDTIRKITPDGVVTTLAGQAGVSGFAEGIGVAALFAGPGGIATDTAGNVYVADTINSAIRKITPAGVVTTLASSLAGGFSPEGVATDTAGNVYVADAGHCLIRKVTPVGVVTTLAGTDNGTLEVQCFGNADGVGVAAQFDHPGGVATDMAGNVYVADTGNDTIRKITPTGVVTTLAGSASAGGSADGIGAAARFNAPQGIVLDSVGDLYVADILNSAIRKITPAGVVTTLTGTAGAQGGADGIAGAAQFYNPQGIASDAAGNIYVADTGNDTVREITPGGVVTTLAGQPGVVSLADGTGPAAGFNHPAGIATGTAGIVYVADTQFCRIREITTSGVVTTVTTSGVVTTVAGQSGCIGRIGVAAFNGPQGIASDTAGNVYVADSGNDMIRKITPAGLVTNLAGQAGVVGSVDGTGAAAQFNYPEGIATDAAGNVYVADTGNDTIRKITPAGVVTTLAGQAGDGGHADGVGPAARFSAPFGVATDTTGDIYVADTGNSTIRKITPDGVVGTVVGVPGVVGFTPGTLPGVIGKPQGVAISGTSLYITLYNGVAVVKDVP